MDRFILYRVRENGSPAPPMHERIRSARYEKVHDTFSLTVLIETKAPSMSMMKKEIKGFQTAWILFKCQRSRWSWKMKMMLLLVTMTIRTTVMTPEDFGRCRVNDIRKFSSPVSVVIPRITFESTAEQNGNHLGTSYNIIRFLITSPEEGRLVHLKYRETSSCISLCYFVIYVFPIILG